MPQLRESFRPGTEPVSKEPSGWAAGTPVLTVVIPVHNEAEGLPAFHRELQKALASGGVPAEILYVDDGSTDGSGRVLEALGVKAVKLDHNMGYGAAIKIGIRQARGGFIAIIDADLTYSPEDLVRLYLAMEGCDMIVGQRPAERGLRFLAKAFLQGIASYAVDYPIADINSGLRIFRRAMALDLFRLLPNGFSLTSTITLGALYMPYRVRYLPIEYRQRVGRSKIRRVRALMHFTMLILRTMVLFNPLKFFLPASAACALAGAAFVIRDLLQRDLAQSSVLLMVNAAMLFAIGLLAEAIRCRE